MTNLQHQLADFTERVAPRSYRSKPPLAFSVCSEGPTLELWVHYTTSLADVREYNINIVRSCHASLLKEVTEFLMAVDNVMNWAIVDFVDDVVEQLFLVEKTGQWQPGI